MASSDLVYYELYQDLLSLKKECFRARRVQPSPVDLRVGDQYIVWAHAVVEFYLEELCRRAVHSVVSRELRLSRMPAMLASLMEAYYWHRASNSSSFEFLSRADHVSKSVKWYVAKIDSNNGIRRSNLLNMILPLGAQDGDLDDLWLDEMDSFGSDRGDIAHGRQVRAFGRAPLVLPGASSRVQVWTSGATRIRQQLAPWDADSKIANVRDGFKELDKWVLSRCRI
jgi:hypothetical protein